MTKKHYGPTIDVYAFAMIAYEIVTGNVPFGEEKNLFSLARKVESGVRPEFPKFVPKK